VPQWQPFESVQLPTIVGGEQKYHPNDGKYPESKEMKKKIML
jgi:hypothetical protein